MCLDRLRRFLLAGILVELRGPMFYKLLFLARGFELRIPTSGASTHLPFVFSEMSSNSIGLVQYDFRNTADHSEVSAL